MLLASSSILLALDFLACLSTGARASYLALRQENGTVPESSQAANVTDATTTNISVTESDVTLSINYLGKPIPYDILDNYLYWGSETVRRLAEDQADVSIKNGRWTFGQVSEVEITVAADLDKVVTYGQLVTVLEGLEQFMIHDNHPRNLQFSIEVADRRSIGYGLVWHDSSSSTDVAKRSSNSTPNALLLPLLPENITSPPTAAASEQTSYPLHDSSFTLVFDISGGPIPPAEFEEAYTASTLKIQPSLALDPYGVVPGGRFQYDDSDCHLLVWADRLIPITWLGLSQILGGVHDFVTGEPTHYQSLHYGINLSGVGKIGFGLVFYHPHQDQITAET